MEEPIAQFSDEELMDNFPAMDDGNRHFPNQTRFSIEDRVLLEFPSLQGKYRHDSLLINQSQYRGRDQWISEFGSSLVFTAGSRQAYTVRLSLSTIMSCRPI